MTFWLIAGLMAAVVAAALVWPLTRRRASAARERYDLAVYRDQLAEIERDCAAGLIGANEAEAAKAEVARRILALDVDSEYGGEEDGTARVASPLGTRIIAVSIALLLPVAAVFLYWTHGTPGLPGLPLAERQASPQDIDSPNAAMIGQVKRRLSDTPGDADGWLLLAGLYRQDGLAEESAEAYRRTLALQPDRVEALMGLAESLVALHRGEVVAEARQLFARVLDIEPNTPMAFYYAGLALAQDGRLEEARGVWTRLLDASPADAPWVSILRRQLARLATELGDGADAPAPAGDEDFIRSMVERLEGRLQDSPDDVEGWIMLARSYRVLGETRKAAAALARAEAVAGELPQGSPLGSALEAEREAQAVAP